jgi:hypothetical protein
MRAQSHIFINKCSFCTLTLSPHHMCLDPLHPAVQTYFFVTILIKKKETPFTLLIQLRHTEFLQLSFLQYFIFTLKYSYVEY